MFLWQAPRTRAVFGISAEFAVATKVLAAKQGLYNGFLAAGLGRALWLGAEHRGVALFFLGLVLVVGSYGAATASRRVLFVQALPSGQTIVAVLMGVSWECLELGCSPPSDLLFLKYFSRSVLHFNRFPLARGARPTPPYGSYALSSDL